MKSFLLICLATLCLACGSGDETIDIPLSFTGDAANAFSDPAASDLVIIVLSQITDGQALDLDGNGSPDSFVAPTACGSAIPDGCGYDITQSQEVSIGRYPLGFNYNIIVRVRDVAGQTLYEGESTFFNDKGAAGVAVSLAASP